MSEPASVGGLEGTDLEGARLRAQLAVDAAGIGTFDWDLTSGRLLWDERLIVMFGYEVSSFSRSIEAFNARLHPDDLVRVTEALDTAIAACDDYEADYRVVLPTGDTRWISARGRALAGPSGTAVRVIGVAYDVTAEVTGEARVTRVLEAMPAGFYSLDPQWRFAHVNAEAERLLQHSRDELLGQVIWDAFPAAVNSIFEESYRKAVATGEPVSFDAHYPAPLNGWYELRAWPTPDGLSVYFIEVTERRLAQEQAERSARRLALLAQVSAELASTLDAGAAVAELAELVVPALTDWSIVSVLDPVTGPRDVGSWHPDPHQRERVAGYSANRWRALSPLAPASWSLRTGERAVSTGAELLTELAPGVARDRLAELAPDVVVALPMRGRGRTLGLLTLYYEGGRAPSEEELSTAQDVADRAGLALDNTRLYGQQQALAEGLQRSLLTDPPEPDHAEIVVRYLPAVEAARVGGDWYDAFLQPNGATMLVIGDVAGHDTAAAATMGQLRSLLRGIAAYSDAGPAEVLRGLDSAMSVLQLDTLATAAIARFEQTPDERARGVTRMVWANAGHLPPLALNPDTSVTVLADWQADLLLGVDSSVTRTENVVTLDRGTTVLLCTDGLIERRDADLDAGLQRLRTSLSELAGLPLQQLCDELIDRLVDGKPEDDVALVAVRLHPQDRPRPPEAGPNRVPDGVPPDPGTR